MLEGIAQYLRLQSWSHENEARQRGVQRSVGCACLCNGGVTKIGVALLRLLFSEFSDGVGGVGRGRLLLCFVLLQFPLDWTRGEVETLASVIVNRQG